MAVETQQLNEMDDEIAMLEYLSELRSGFSSEKLLVLRLSPWNNSAAFINGIEVVSVPSGEFPSTKVMPVPFGEHPNIAFETAYISYKHGRTSCFSSQPAAARSFSADPGSIKYPDGVSIDISPIWVYATAQGMTDAKVSNQKINISWAFDVEKDISYLIRLHFGNIVTFDLQCDKEIISSLFVDFVTNVSVDENRIFVQVGPPMLRDLPFNANLNGLEIMKMSTRRDSLDGTFQRITTQI
ncbi:hypothetical protein DVH24_023146 [Malus domestica]|uniref:Malectin-like domain-containing protein n=1 Tax=Malus domestica TaxID=3750 RepID=A0A498KTH3_MALDO|nr:hypothetical protein DVH24_023146 [Malus domestica]